MKKIIALVVAVLMMAAIAVPAFAAWDTQYNANGNVTEVTFGVEQSYVVKIPQKVDFGTKLTTNVTIEASGVRVSGTQVLQVKVASDNYTTTWNLVDTNTHEEEREGVKIQVPNSENVPYTIKVGSTVVVSDDTVVLSVDSDDALTTENDVTSGTKGSVQLDFATAGTSQVGVYKDILTFSAAVVSTVATPEAE